MLILGLGGSTHDKSCCLLEDGVIKYSIEEERISKEKYGVGIRSDLFQSIDYCLKANNCKLSDIDLIVTNDLLTFHPSIANEYLTSAVRINHHLAHAASAYYTSPFDQSAILVIDGSGSMYKDNSVETVSLGYAQDNDIKMIKRFNCSRMIIPDFLDIGYKNFRMPLYSLGGLYTLFTYICGFRLLEDGKTMGLSSYGTDRYVEKIKEYIHMTNKLIMEFHVDQRSLYGFIREEFKKRDENSVKADLAFGVQQILEECVFIYMNYLHEITNCDNICYSGGVALNSVLNGKIMEKSSFKNIHILPAAGDSGTAIGAALYAYHNIYKHKYYPHKELQNFCLGKTYTESEIEKELAKFQEKLKYQKHEQKQISKKVAEELSKGKIVAWFQKGSEIGPRALGHRSILVDPRRSEMKDILNSRVKFREEFRPFAPAVLEEYAQDYFDIQQGISPYMLFVSQVKEDKIDKIPATTHVDHTARVQTVHKSLDERFYSLIKEFYNITGIPVLLNTSFNIKGKPIVETPWDALNTFNASSIDVLVIENYIITKMNSEM